MDETSEASASASVGTRLRVAREARGQTLDEIAQQTRIPARHLARIEANRFEGLPAAPYSTGFVKSYARAVGLDPVELSQDFRADLSHQTDTTPRIAYEPYEPADPTRLPPRLLAVVALVIAVLLAGGYGIWRSGVLSGEGPGSRAQLAASGDDAATPANTAVPTTAPAVPPATAPVPTGGAVVLTALKPVWFKVSERDGATLFVGTLDQGKTFDVPATATDPVIRTGKPEAIGVTVAGLAVAPLGKPAHIIADVSLKPDALRARLKDDGAATSPASDGSTRKKTNRTSSDGDSPSSDTPSAAVPPASNTGGGATNAQQP